MASPYRFSQSATQEGATCQSETGQLWYYHMIYFKGEGAFAKKNINSNTIVAQYGGYRMDRSQHLPIQISSNGQYRHNIGLGRGVLDIPSGYENIDKYNGTMAHKFNHIFYKENCRMEYVR